MGTASPIKDELDRVLGDPVFVRSPILTRLLRYLVDQSVAGVEHLKSYTVAVEGLGRDAAFDASSDSYARVQIGRLRRALDAYYAAREGTPGPRLAFSDGSYLVHLEDSEDHVAAAAVPEVPQPELAGPRPVHAWQPVALTLACLLGAVALVLFQARQEAANWSNVDYPIVAVQADYPGGAGNAVEANALRHRASYLLSRYPAIRVAPAGASQSDYLIRLGYRHQGNVLFSRAEIIDQRRQRVIWSAPDAPTGPPGAGVAGADAALADITVRAASANGLIHGNERRNTRSADTPYGCWLLFGADLQRNLFAPDKASAACAEKWYRAVPTNPTAAEVYSWTLMDRAAASPTREGYDRLLTQALRIVEEHQALHPEAINIFGSAIRVYSMAGNTTALRQAAARAIRLNGENPALRAYVGAMLALYGEPLSADYLHAAGTTLPDTPPWALVGQFLLAMMRDDVAAAGEAWSRMGRLAVRPHAYHVLSAAYLARTGRTEPARTAWRRALRRDVPNGLSSEEFLRRLPVSPAVAARLKEWLGPVPD